MSVIKYDDIKQRLQSSAKDEDISPFTAVDKYGLMICFSSSCNIAIKIILLIISLFSCSAAKLEINR